MLDTIAFFFLLRVVETIDRSYQITGDPADLLKLIFALGIISSALRTDVSFDHTAVSATRITVDRMVDAAITDVVLLHAANDRLKGFQVIARIAVHLYIGDVPAVGERMIRSLQTDLVKGADMVIDRNVERVRIIFTIRDAFQLAEDLLVDPREATGQTFGRCSDQREVEMVFLRRLSFG